MQTGSSSTSWVERLRNAGQSVSQLFTGEGVDSDEESNASGEERSKRGGQEGSEMSDDDPLQDTRPGAANRRAEAVGRQVQAEKDQRRPKNTYDSYGGNDYGKGPKREFFQFCAAEPGDTVNGVLMDDGKACIHSEGDRT